MQVALTHRTTYRYDRPVSLGPQLIRLRPAPHARMAIPHYALSVAPEAEVRWQQDPFANWIARAIVAEPAERLEVAVALTIDLAPVNPFDFLVELYAIDRPFAYEPDLRADLAPYLQVEAAGERFEAFVGRFAERRGGTVQFLIDLNAAVHAEVDYRRRVEVGTQPPEETLAIASGSCRDSGWLLVQLMRRLGIAARFVSGYSIQLADGAEVKEDAVDLHAWAEAYLPGAGWIGFDPTSGLLAGEGHVPLAAAPHYRSTMPVEGKVYGEGRGELDFELGVRRLAT